MNSQDSLEDMMETGPGAGVMTVPAGPAEPYNVKDDLFQWLKSNFEKYGSIYKASIYGSNVYVISDPAYCEHILRFNWENYPRKGFVVQRIALSLGNGLIASNGMFWANQRRMVQTAYTKAAISRATNMIRRTNADLLESWKNAAKAGYLVNVTHDVSELVLKITLLSIFGEDYEKIASDFALLCENRSRTIQFAASVSDLGKLVLAIITRRRSEGRNAEDTLGTLMRVRARDTNAPMPDKQLIREVLTLVVAGHETTASLLNWLWWLLAKHPDVHEALAKELHSPGDMEPTETDFTVKCPYTRQVIDEALRLYPPLWLMTRKALHNDQIGPYHIPAGTEIFISPYLIQHSPRLWPHPEIFDPDRMASSTRLEDHKLSFCPFGAGPRNCIGEQFARLEIQIHLMMVASQLRMVAHDEAVPEQDAAGLNLLSKEDLLMQPQIIDATAL